VPPVVRVPLLHFAAHFGCSLVALVCCVVAELWCRVALVALPPPSCSSQRSLSLLLLLACLGGWGGLSFFSLQPATLSFSDYLVTAIQQ
jgi:hypothetical protein